MAESWSNVETIFSSEAPGDPYDGIFFNYDTESYWYGGSGVVFKGDIEVWPSLYVRVESGLLE